MFNILGIYSGIGPNLYPAKQMGWNVLANFEPRKGFHSGTWEANFGDIPIYKDWDHIEDYVGKVDILVAFPSCGYFSQIGHQGLTPERKAERRSFFGEFEKCREVIELVKPKIFFIENVLLFLQYHKFTVNGYSMYEIKMQNCDYGNTQLRKRLWITGKNDSIHFEFTPPLFVQARTLRDAIGDLPPGDIEEMQHVHLVTNLNTVSCALDGETYKTDEGVAKYSFDFPPLIDLPYISKDGKRKKRIGLMRCNWDWRAPLISTAGSKLHPDTGMPLTIRERARIMGFPDEFKFAGTYKEMLIQTGACVPLEFPTYLYKLIEKQNR